MYATLSELGNANDFCEKVMISPSTKITSSLLQKGFEALHQLSISIEQNADSGCHVSGINCAYIIVFQDPEKFIVDIRPCVANVIEVAYCVVVIRLRTCSGRFSINLLCVRHL